MLLLGLAGVAVVALVRNAIPDLRRFIKIEKM